MITKFKIFESDSIYLPNGEEIQWCDDREEPIPFFVWENDLYVGEIGSNHPEMLERLIGFEEAEADKYNYKHNGRLFKKRKYIIFWHTPDPRTLKDILYDLEEQLGIHFMGTGWKIQFIYEDPVFFKIKAEEDEETYHTKTIPLDDYIHKSEIKGSKTIPLAYKQAIYSESKRNESDI